MPVYDHVNTTTRKIKFMREAGAVRRCHTVPIIGEYSVGVHVYNMLSMLRVLYPDAPMHLVWAILEHDAPERLTGDIPAPPKWFGVVNKDALAQIENDILVDTVGHDHMIQLNKEEQGWLKALDIFELALFCRDQIMLGNRNLEVMLDRIHKFVKREAASFEPVVLDAYWESFGDDWSMLPDLGDI